MTGQEAVERIHQEAWIGREPGLSRITKLLSMVGDPHKELKFVHITGTNGKGSTASMTASILAAAGLRVGLYTSPHLWRFHERFQVCGRPIPDEALGRIGERVILAGRQMDDPATEFELMTALGMLYFQEAKCDLVVLCRQLTADPFFTQKVREGRAEEIRRCLRCMRCYPGPFEEAWAELNGQFPEGCSINPCADHPERWRVEPAEEKKTVLIVGGGVAGLQAAVTARDRGHEVVLLEKSGQLGGILNFSVHDPDKNDLAGFARAMEAQARAKGADLRLNTVLTGERLADIRPDEVILAIGSHPLLPPIPGLDGANVVQAMDAYAPDAKLGHKVVVLGGGLVGCETAVHLWKQGHEVELVEMREELAPDAYRLHKRRLRELIAQHVKTHMGARCLAVTEAGVQVEGPDGSVQLIPADTVVAALGMRANDTGELEALVQRAGVPCHKIGDCVRARKIYDAVSEGYLTALSL